MIPTVAPSGSSGSGRSSDGRGTFASPPPPTAAEEGTSATTDDDTSGLSLIVTDVAIGDGGPRGGRQLGVRSQRWRPRCGRRWGRPQRRSQVDRHSHLRGGRRGSRRQACCRSGGGRRCRPPRNHWPSSGVWPRGFDLEKLLRGRGGGTRAAPGEKLIADPHRWDLVPWRRGDRRRAWVPWVVAGREQLSSQATLRLRPKPGGFGGTCGGGGRRGARSVDRPGWPPCPRGQPGTHLFWQGHPSRLRR